MKSANPSVSSSATSSQEHKHHAEQRGFTQVPARQRHQSAQSRAASQSRLDLSVPEGSGAQRENHQQKELLPQELLV